MGAERNHLSAREQLGADGLEDGQGDEIGAAAVIQVRDDRDLAYSGDGGDGDGYMQVIKEQNQWDLALKR